MDKERAPIVIKVAGDEHTIDWDSLIANEETINDDLKKQPAEFAYYAFLSELAEGEYQDAKMALERKEAELDSGIRETSEKKPTEKDIANRILLNDEYLAMRDYMNGCRRTAGILRVFKDAWTQKKDMLITLASNMRAGMDMTVKIKTKKD